ncbi:hypothetical protein QFC19_000711 [Naganishia cerealis]|uniref:Uncharacterized protein n=1 Tax=Naganishia cerealis TaxID=610337 RepID=A0ACC2WP61_9TREE|nr:hypothetical protein QFC19_000711 [Naganishia cerealis]
MPLLSDSNRTQEQTALTPVLSVSLTAQELVIEWQRLQGSDTDFTSSSYQPTFQPLKELRRIYEKGMNALAGVTNTSPHIETVVAATAVLELYSQLPCTGKFKNFYVADLTFEGLHLVFGELRCTTGMTDLILLHFFLAKTLKEWANDDIMDCYAQVLCRAAYRKGDQADTSKTLIGKSFSKTTYILHTEGDAVSEEPKSMVDLEHRLNILLVKYRQVYVHTYPTD